MKLGIFAFTGTGNTLRVCNMIANELEENGATTQINMIIDIKDDIDLEDYDKIIFANPVHGFNTPQPMLDFMKRLPKSDTKKQVYLIRVTGEPLKLNDAAGIVPKRILAKKGYVVMGEFMYVMPYNIIFHHTDKMATRMGLTAKAKVVKDVRAILADESRLTKNSVFAKMVSFACSIEHKAMPMFGKHFKSTDKCSGCGLCANVCPMGNIEMVDGKPVFHNKCVGCMGCSFKCPNDAITTYILNGWRVNGAYNFNDTPATDEEICDYCKKSYINYFHQNENIEDSQK